MMHSLTYDIKIQKQHIGVLFMTWEYIFVSLLIGIFIGIITMYYKNRNLLYKQKIMHNELQNNKIKLNEYQQELHHHFAHSIELLNKMAENYRHLYHNIKKSANFFLPNTHIQDSLYTFQSNLKNTDSEQLPIKTPRDYPENIENIIKNNHTK